jgi:thiol:disulfide interchange protein DsbD
MEKSTLSDARVQDALGHFVLIQADVTETSKDTLAIKQRFRVLGPPAMLFFAANGEENQAARFYGYRKAEEFLALLAKL